MKYLSSSLIALGFALTAAQAQAQDAAPPAPPPDNGAAAQPQPDAAAQSATPAPDTDAQPAPDAAAPPQSSPAPEAASPQTAEPDASTAAPSSIQVSDTEIDQFAQATVKVQKIDADTTLDANAKQTQMAAAVKSTGLDPARYNEIAKAIPTDDALRSKVQMAMAKYATPSQG